MQVVQIAFPVILLALLGSAQAQPPYENDLWHKQCHNLARDYCRGGTATKDSIRSKNYWSCLCSKWTTSDYGPNCLTACGHYNADESFCNDACAKGTYYDRRDATVCKEQQSC
ncbi:hypothetical protein A4X06_0g8779 [Tilletia controversa]|uniref:Secreted protein n=1 Tax=Tilletia controversa TaxID=13291 RepID=A0A8X7MJQ3_9BASI|nr:hypothetical protein CF328_g8230 [Tilletia controversa]KAE8238405.1 hypothetical protein A4X06_0g8779 [Tilletia controversa]